MKVNWPERLWVNSPVRRYVQQRESVFFSRAGRLAPGAKCLEIGCGCGVGAQLIGRYFAPAEIHALDIDAAMLDTARKKLAKWNGLPLRLLAADAQELPYPDHCFDAVFNFGIIHHLENWRKGLAEIARVLKEDGVFYFEEIYPPLYANPLFRRILDHPREDRFHGPDFRAALAAAGLRLLDGYKESRFAILGIAVSEARNRKTEDREQRAEARGQKPEAGGEERVQPAGHCFYNSRTAWARGEVQGAFHAPGAWNAPYDNSCTRSNTRFASTNETPD